MFRLIFLFLVLIFTSNAQAFFAVISKGPQELYLRVGTGSAAGNYATGGTMLNNSTINQVSVDVPAFSIGNGVVLDMNGNAGVGFSHYDGLLVCTDPDQIYLGGYFRSPTGGAGGGDAILTSLSPAFLVSLDGFNIPISEVSWISSDRAKPKKLAILSGTFAPGNQILETFKSNQWKESCHSYYYANNFTMPAGDYRARITYTITSP